MKRTRFLALLMTLCLLTGLAVAEGCTICGGDAVCDTCGGLGYLEMKTLSGEMAQVACFGGCVDGKCPDCAVACDICGSDGLCDTCGGLGYLEMKAYGSDEMLQIACTGENCAAGKCAVCGAGAEVAAVEEVAAEEVAADVPQGTYTFVEPEVEQEVRYRLYKWSDDITYEDLRSVTKLVLGDKVSSYEDLTYMPNLTDLSLPNVDIKDLSPLAGFTNLTVLDLSTNEISDLSPLAGMTNLTKLDLSWNNISDLSPLAGMTNLTKLDLGWNSNISDLSPLAGLTNLTELSLSHNKISDIEPLSGLTDLSILWLNDNQLSDISPLAGLTDLTQLYLYENSISDIEPLSGLTDLSILWLNDNHISDISPLAGLTNLSTLSLMKNQIADFSPLDGLDIYDLNTEDNHPATPTPSPYQAPIVGNDGLHVMSPEEYSSLIEPCDHISLGSNSNYYYRYFGLGQEYGSNGDNDEWAKFERYARALVDSGYYEVSHHLQDNLENSWHLKYIGPQKVNTVMGKNAAIIVSSLLGDVYVYYDLDIETSGRANIVDSNPQPNGSDGKEWCRSCGNTGKCSTCHGDKKVKKHVAGTTDYIYQDCLTCSGDGKCNSCGGDGWR